MADASDRIIILSAVVLVIIALLPNSGLMRPLGTVFDIEVEITTSRDSYTLGESFTATLHLVNNGSKDVWMNPIYELQFLGNSVNDPEPTTGIIDLDWIQGAKIHVPPKSKFKLFELDFKPQYSGAFLISCFGVKKTVQILEPEREYQVLWEGELEVADPRFLSGDKNESLDMSAFQGLSSKLTSLVRRGVPEIKNFYVHHSMDWQNGTAYIVLTDISENVTRFILDQFSPPVQEKIRFLKSSASRSQIREWRGTLMELCLGRLKERGVIWTAMGTYYDGRILLYVQEISPETIDIIEEVIEGSVPPGIVVIREADLMTDLVEQDIDSIESSAESASAIQLGRDFLSGEGMEAGMVLSIEIMEKEPNFYWDYSLKFDRPDLIELRKCYVIKFEQKQRPGHFYEVWLDASEYIIVGGQTCR